MIRVLQWVWAFPLSLVGWAIAGRNPGPNGTRIWFTGYPIRVHRYACRYATALWPYILVKRPEQVRSIELMHHEARHLHQQMWVGGVLFSLTYAVCWLALLPFHGAQGAYRRVPWERDARRYAHRKMEERKKRG